MDDFCMRSEMAQLSGDTVIEPCADRDKEIGLGYGVICIFCPVHPEHAEI